MHPSVVALTHLCCHEHRFLQIHLNLVFYLFLSLFFSILACLDPAVSGGLLFHRGCRRVPVNTGLLNTVGK